MKKTETKKSRATVPLSYIFQIVSSCRTAVGVAQRALSAHIGGDPLPTSGPGEGDVITPAKFLFARLMSLATKFVCESRKKRVLLQNFFLRDS
jgi:hypothetical protein